MTGLTYSDYVQTGTLLSLQKTHAPVGAGADVHLAEHFFIVAHQCSELWLKQVLADLETVAALLSAGGGEDDLDLAGELLRRAGEVLRLMHEQVVVLERLPLRCFVAFRPHLGTASGAGSDQFRLLAGLIGGEGTDGVLYRAFESAAAQRRLSVADVCRAGFGAGALHRIAESLLDVGNGYWRWKVAHLGLTSSIVGEQEGTGGTSGTEYLVRRITVPFPELRRLRGVLHPDLTDRAR
jgi:tryptophan 2,3-dioxygenase